MSYTAKGGGAVYMYEVVRVHVKMCAVGARARAFDFREQAEQGREDRTARVPFGEVKRSSRAEFIVCAWACPRTHGHTVDTTPCRFVPGPAPATVHERRAGGAGEVLVNCSWLKFGHEGPASRSGTANPGKPLEKTEHKPEKLRVK